MPLKAVLFDLDDTLFDHKYSYHQGLEAMYNHAEILQTKPIQVLFEIYHEALESFHSRVVNGEITLPEARILRTKSIFSNYNQDITTEEAQSIDKVFRTTYMGVQRVVPGAIELLEAVKERNLKIGIVTNHIIAEQERKLAALKLTHFVDDMVTAGDIGKPKPDPLPFEMSLKNLAIKPDETVMVGDSWRSDIEGATNMGIRSIWLNRYEHTNPNPELAVEITSLEPLDAMLDLLALND